MSGSTLKILAVISMLIDHFGAVFFPANIYLRIVGRLAFPIFCFLLVEGYFHTRDIKKYIGRLLVFAFVSEVPFDYAFYGIFPMNAHQNIFFTLSIGLVCIYLLEKIKYSRFPVLSFVVIALAICFAKLLYTDYDIRGVLYILCFYYMRGHTIKEKIPYVLIFAMLCFGGIQAYAILALIPIYFYNGKRGIKLEYFFYYIYPIHLALFAIIRGILSYGQGMGAL